MHLKNRLLNVLTLLGAVLLSTTLSKAVFAVELDCKTPYTVALGDTLGSIAERAYGDSAQFNRIYYANQDVLTTGPTVIRIGQELRIPCAEEEAEEKTDVEDAKSQQLSESTDQTSAAPDQADSTIDQVGEVSMATQETSRDPTNEPTDSIIDEAGTVTQEAPQDITASNQASSATEQPDPVSDQPDSAIDQVNTTVQDTSQDSSPAPDQINTTADQASKVVQNQAEGDTQASISDTKSADNTAQPSLQPQRKLELLTAGDYAPFTDPELEGGGLITELLGTLMKRSEIPYRLDWINDWAAHLSPLLTEKKYDIGFPWLDPGCPESNSPRCDFLFSKPVFELLIVLFIRADEPLTFDKDDDILGKALCRPAGYFTHDLDNNGRNWLKDGKITLERPKNVEDCFDLLVDGEVDAVAINDFTGRESIAKQGLQNKVTLLERELSIEGLHALVHKTHPQASIMIGQINRGLEELHVSGQYDKIMDRHLRNHWKSIESNKHKGRSPHKQ